MVRAPITQIIKNNMNNKNTIPGLFEEHTNQFTEHIAVIHGDHSLTYSELNKKRINEHIICALLVVNWSY